jgi:GWxTD domain-containing protein
MRARYAGRLLAGLLLCLAPLAAAAQASGFGADLVTRRAVVGGVPDVRLDVLTAVSHPALQFRARTDGFAAAYAVTVDVREATEDGAGRLVLSRTAEHEVRVRDYAATQDGAAESQAVASLDVPPGRYAVTVTVEDVATGRASTWESVHTVRDVARPAVALSDPVLMRTYDAGAGTGQPIVGAVVPTEAEAFWVACDVYADAPATLRATYVVTERSRVRERPSFGALLGLAPRERADLGTPVAVTEPIEVRAGRTSTAFRVDAADLEVGDYALVVRLETPSGAVLGEAEKTFAVRWTGLDRQLADLDEAIAQLRYVARESEVEAIRNATSPVEQLRLFRQFWSRRDPSPGTPRNERMEEYYYRVASANERWGGARANGWSTDPGEVFIRFGEPDEVEVHEATYGTRSYQEWRYYGQGRRFIFFDATGSGDFQLAFPIWDERTRM